MWSILSRTSTPRVLRGRAPERLHLLWWRRRACKPREPYPVEAAAVEKAPEKLEPMEVTEFDAEEEAGTRVPLKTADPRLPAAEEIDAHNLTHLPYRSWCPHCVRGKGKTMDHRQAGSGDPRGLQFHGSKTDVTTRCIVVAKDYSSKSVVASVVPVKGSSHEFPAKRMNAFIRELGLEAQDLVLRSDQEPALQDLLAEVGRRRVPVQTFCEVSPVGSSASNRVAERGVQTVEWQIRVLKDAF